MPEIISLEGPVEMVDGQLVLLIPLRAGGEALSKVARGISAIEGDFLKITIPDWLVKKLEIREGSVVSVNNRDGKLNILPRQERPN